MNFRKSLKETPNLFKKWILNLWCVSNKAIMEVESITKVAIFKSFLSLSYKNTQLLSLWQCFLIFLEKNINRWFLGVTQKYELRVSFKKKFRACEECFQFINVKNADEWFITYCMILLQCNSEVVL